MIEILCVLAIFVILLSIAVASSVHWGRATRMRGSIQAARSSLDQARQWAVTHGAPTAFVFANAPNLPRGYFVVASSSQGVIGTTNYLASGIVWDGTTGSIAFLPDGSADEPADRLLVLSEANRGAAGLVSTITVYRVTGRTRVEE
jgi:Tfp pilus assembly protein FimT